MPGFYKDPEDFKIDLDLKKIWKVLCIEDSKEEPVRYRPHNAPMSLHITIRTQPPFSLLKLNITEYYIVGYRLRDAAMIVRKLRE